MLLTEIKYLVIIFFVSLLLIQTLNPFHILIDGIHMLVQGIPLMSVKEDLLIAAFELELL